MFARQSSWCSKQNKSLVIERNNVSDRSYKSDGPERLHKELMGMLELWDMWDYP